MSNEHDEIKKNSQTVDSKKNQIEIEVNTEYVNEKPVVSGEVVDAANYFDSTFSKVYSASIEEKDLSLNFFKVYDTDYVVPGLNMNDLKAYRESGHSAEETYRYFKDYIKENQNNPEVVRATVSRVLNYLNSHYDESKKHIDLGSNQADLLDRFINLEDKEQCSGLICTTIHKFMMDTLHEVGIEAVGVNGVADGGGHVTLLYKLTDGEYVFNDYGESLTIKANNIKDATKIAYRYSNLSARGNLSIRDADKMYQEFAYKKEMAFGNEYDKSSYNAVLADDNAIPQKTSIVADNSISNLSNISSTITGNFVTESKNKSDTFASFSLGYKKN